MWAAQYYQYTQPRTFISSGGLGTMGYGLPAAIGAKVGSPKNRCMYFRRWEFSNEHSRNCDCYKRNLAITPGSYEQWLFRYGKTMAGAIF